MKRWKTRLLAGVLSAAAVASAASAVQITDRGTLQLSEHTELAGKITRQGAQIVREQILTYEPGGDVRPMVAYGSGIYGRSTMDYIQEHLQQQNLLTVAAINGAFFDLSTGVPYGMVVTEGILRSSGTGNTVCIWEDGSISIEDPMLEMDLIWNDMEITVNYNKAMSKENGYCLYSRDHGSRTANSLAGYNLILEPERDSLRPSDHVRATVLQILPDTASCTIPEGCFVLSLAQETVYASAAEQIRQMAVGDTVTITAQVKRGCEKLYHAVGGGDLLVDDGKALSAFTLDSADRPAARTALGVKANGEVVCYAADKGEYSDGLTLAELAERMKELGCVKAVNLDGGGSTTVGATLPGRSSFTTVNAPADGSQRACANFLFFVRPDEPAGAAVRLHVYPHDAAVLRGGKVELSVTATDQNYLAASVPGDAAYSAEGGSISGNVFTALRTGTAVVTASAGGLTGRTSIQVVETPTELSVRREDQNTALEKLVIESGEAVDLTADAVYLGMELAAEDYAFGWYVDPKLGRITDDGVFTASDYLTTGRLEVTCGDLQVQIPVEVRPNPFADTKGHWAGSYITELYYADVLQGSGDADGKLYYRPDASMTRQEFVTAMMRAQQVDPADYAHVELPFADQNQIAPWAEDAMKAAYELGWFTGSGKGETLYAEPNDTITREAAMTILARSISARSDSDILMAFSDGDRVSSWARPALSAMVEQGIIDGINGALQPQGNVTRAQVAKMLYTMR